MSNLNNVNDEYSRITFSWAASVLSFGMGVALIVALFSLYFGHIGGKPLCTKANGYWLSRERPSVDLSAELGVREWGGNCRPLTEEEREALEVKGGFPYFQVNGLTVETAWQDSAPLSVRSIRFELNGQGVDISFAFVNKATQKKGEASNGSHALLSQQRWEMFGS